MAKKKAPPVPEMTHAQFLVVDTIGERSDGAMLGTEIRKKISTLKKFETSPGFYQFMARMVRLGYVVPSRSAGDYRSKCYQTTAVGEKHYNKTIEFYEYHTSSNA